MMFITGAQPTIVAAGIAAVTTLVTLLISNTINAGLQRQRVQADIDLADRRFSYEQKLARWKRKYEFGEVALKDFYEARSRLSTIRSGLSYSTEAEKRPGRDEEPDYRRRFLDRYYSVETRLAEATDFLNGLYARRYMAVALFGTESEEPFKEFWEASMLIAVALRTLNRLSFEEEITSSIQDTIDKAEARIWEGWGEQSGGPGDEVASKMERAVSLAEELFRPVLSEQP